MPFSPGVKEDALVACGRHCCVCHAFCGTKIEVHHIKLETEGGEDTFENAIPLCFNCHADMRSYDAKHPKGNKYSMSELKRHRDHWYRKVEGGYGPVRLEETIATDKKVYETLIRVLPWDGSLHFIRHKNFAGFSFKVDQLNEFHEFEHQCENPSFEFIDPDLEGLRVALHRFVREFMLQLASKTFPTNTAGWNSLPEDWEDEQPERFKKVVNGLHSAAQGTCDSYDALVKLAIRKLGIIPIPTQNHPHQDT